MRAVLICLGGHTHTVTHTHTHTHPFNGSLSGTTRASRYQKGKTNLDFTEARDSEWQWHQLSRMQACTSLQTDNHASIPPLSFLQAGCPSCRPTNSVSALKAMMSRRSSGRNCPCATARSNLGAESTAHRRRSSDCQTLHLINIKPIHTASHARHDKTVLSASRPLRRSKYRVTVT